MAGCCSSTPSRSRKTTFISTRFDSIAREHPIDGLRWSMIHLQSIDAPRLKSAHGSRRRRQRADVDLSVGGGGPPFRRIVDSGIHAGVGTDSTNVSALDPWLSLFYMTTGRNLAGMLTNDGQQVSRVEALRLYTEGAAWFSFDDHQVGSFVEGKYADLAVLSHDYLTVPEPDDSEDRIRADAGRRQDRARLGAVWPPRRTVTTTDEDSLLEFRVFVGRGRFRALTTASGHQDDGSVQLLIGGRDVAASNGATFNRVNPVTGDVATRASAATVADARAAADAGAAAFPQWSALGPNERRTRLNKAADLLEGRAQEFARLGLAEMGATAGWGHFNVHFAASLLREAAAMTTQVSGEVIPTDVPGNLAMAVRQPAGVVLGIAPWNAAVILGVRAVAMPLACGNTVILKASEVCPASHRLIGTVLNEAGMGNGVVNVITHDPRDAEAVAEAMISHPAVRRVNFTGSTRVGRILALIAAKYLKPILLELGGKAPLVVLDDADVDAAVDATVFGAFANAGQICMSTERVIVADTVADKLPRSSRGASPACRRAIPTRATSSSDRSSASRRSSASTFSWPTPWRKAPECSPAAKATARS